MHHFLSPKYRNYHHWELCGSFPKQGDPKTDDNILKSFVRILKKVLLIFSLVLDFRPQSNGSDITGPPAGSQNEEGCSSGCIRGTAVCGTAS